MRCSSGIQTSWLTAEGLLLTMQNAAWSVRNQAS